MKSNSRYILWEHKYVLKIRLLHWFHYELHSLSCHHFFPEILLPSEILMVGNKGNNTPHTTSCRVRDETAA